MQLEVTPTKSHMHPHNRPIGNFQIPKTLTFKMRLNAKVSLVKMGFICLIFISMASHVASLRKYMGQLRQGLLLSVSVHLGWYF